MSIRQVLTDSPVPVKIWTNDVDHAALAQLRNVARLPFVFKHVAAMPDTHWGMGATVGSVLATRGAIVPAAVGVDIGCGMMALETGLDADRLAGKEARLRSAIERRVPVAHKGHTRISERARQWVGWKDARLPQAVEKHPGKPLSQLGTLGGGNHFIEVCHDEQGNLWLMLHSGSRNVGKVTAEQHIGAAKGLMKRYFVDLPDPDLAYLVEQSPEFDRYMNDLLWCQAYAAENREQMMHHVSEAVVDVLGLEHLPTGQLVNCHHNYVARETHFGQDVLVTRKGAVRAGAGDMGIIPGSMGARSYIVRGLGNRDSFCSCAHGAGRRMGRKQAKRTFSLADLERQTQGVECRKDEGVLDEIPGAYKDIDQVMENQRDLVEVVATLKQLVCVKG